jgi:transcriptional regulator with XRE-family HTH domain
VSIYLFGPLIKQRREELGYSQEDLADGICSVPTLSRIENGERLPSKQHSEMLLQRLGYSDSIIINYVDEKTLKLHELKYSIRHAVMCGKLKQARSLLEQFVSMSPCDDPISRQFVILVQTILSDSKNIQEKLDALLTALQLTCPKFNQKELPIILSYEEIILVNDIAVYQAESGQLDSGISLLYQLKMNYERHMVNQEETLRTQLMVLYNLSKYLGNAERYDECIEICDLGIRISRETKKCTQLDKLLYNKAWALLKRGHEKDDIIAKECLRKAICLADALEQAQMKQFYLHFMNERFEE